MKALLIIWYTDVSFNPCKNTKIEAVSEDEDKLKTLAESFESTRIDGELVETHIINVKQI